MKQIVVIITFLISFATIQAQHLYKVEYDFEYMNSGGTCGLLVEANLSNPTVGTGTHRVLRYHSPPGMLETAGQMQGDYVLNLSKHYQRVGITSRMTNNIGRPCSIGPGGGGFLTDSEDPLVKSSSTGLGCFAAGRFIGNRLPNAAGYFKLFRIKPFEEENGYGSTTDYLVDCEPKTLIVTSGENCESIGQISYGVLYQIENNKWETLLPYGKRQPKFTINRSSFYGLRLGQSFRIQIQYDNPSSGSKTYSNPLTYTYISCSPRSTLESVPDCSNASKAKLKITLDRNLSRNEKIYYNLFRSGQDIPTKYGYIYQGDLDANKSYTWPDSQPQDTYEITYNSVFDPNRSADLLTKQVQLRGTPLLNYKLISKTNVRCYGGNNGAINISVSGGSGSYRFSWFKNGSYYSNREDIANLTAGQYKIHITDNNTGCTLEDTFNITQPSNYLSLTSSITQVSGYGLANGIINITPSGGTPPYTYAWSNGRATQDLSGIGPGTYNVVLTDSNGCTLSRSFTITQPNLLTSSITLINELKCFGYSNGSLRADAGGGVPGYTYLWYKNGTAFSTSRTISGLTAANYMVRVTDINGNTTTSSYNLTQPAQLNVSANVTNASGYGLANGSINISPSGGTSSYQYSWSTGQTSQNITGLSAGNYNVTITDAKGCTISRSYTVTQPPLLVNSITVLNTIDCFGDGDGSLRADPSGGAPGYAYQWTKNGSSYATTRTVSNLQPGNYVVRITDSKGNTTSSNYNLTQPSGLAVAGNVTNLTGFGLSNGAINITPSGGTTPYRYAWSNGSTSQDISNIAAGTYSVIITDAKGCALSRSYTVTQPSLLQASLTQLNALDCFGDTNGSLRANGSGGVGAYTYAWTKNGNSYATASTISNLSVGNYRVTVRDQNGNVAAASFNLTQPTQLAVSAAITNVSGFGLSNGSINITPSGGTAPYSYSWSNGATSQDLNNIRSGTYTVTITDAKACVISKSYTVTQPPLLTSTITVLNTLDCYGDANGSLRADSSGGVAGYTYAWKRNGTTYSSSRTISNLIAANYSVTITDANGNKSTSSYNLTQPSNLSLSGVITNATGFGLSNGAINVTPSGGTSPYSYSWSNGSTAQDLNAIVAGTYSITITDAKGCTVSRSFTVTQPPLLKVTGIAQGGQILCFGETNVNLVASITGGVAPYQYFWYKDQNQSTSLSSSTLLSSRGAGSYTFVVIDANGNTASLATVVSQPSQLVVNHSVNNVLCHGDKTGAIDLAVSGGTGNYTYTWSTGATTQDISNLGNGNYSVTVKDGNQCQKTLNFTITQPSNPIRITNSTIVSATGFGLTNGSVEVSVTGGTPPYSYDWFDINGTSYTSSTNQLVNIGAGKYQVRITDANNCSLQSAVYQVTQPDKLIIDEVEETPILCYGETGSIRVKPKGGVKINETNYPFEYRYQWLDSENNTISQTNISGTIAAGTYTVIVTDANGNQVTQQFTLSQPTELNISSISTTDVSCYNGNTGSITINVTGGTPPYEYNWSNDGSSTNTLSELIAGTYTVIVTDANNCQVASNQIEINQPPLYDISAVNLFRPSADQATDGSIRIELTGGNPPFDYTWYDVQGNVLQSEQNTSNSTSIIENLGKNFYTIQVTDNSGCLLEETYNLANQGQLFTSVEQSKDISCHQGTDGELFVNVIGGAGGNDFQWYTASGNPIGQNLNRIGNLSAGDYYVVVTDAEGIFEQSRIISITDPEPVAAGFTQTNLSCNGADNGTIELWASGGNSSFEYRYSINNGVFGGWTAFASGNTSQLSQLESGSYRIEVRDTNAICTDIKAIVEVVLIEPQPLQIVSETLSNPTGFNLTNGSIALTINGGTAPYSFNTSGISGVSEDGDIQLTDLLAGTYLVEVVDTNGCSLTATYQLEQPDELVVAIDRINVNLCHGNAEASLKAIPTGGVSPYSYAWYKQNSETLLGDEAIIENLASGIYYVIIEDANGNTVTSDDIAITAPSPLEITLVSDYMLCGEDSDWQITAEVSGGTPPYNYAWSNGSVTQTIVDLAIGSYTVVITDANGCTSTSSTALNQPEVLAIQDVTINRPSCFGEDDGAIILDVIGGTPPYTYFWNDSNTASTDNSFTNLVAGSYHVLISDDKGCTIEQTITMGEPEQISLTLGDDITLCMNQSLTLNATIADGVEYHWSSDTGIFSEKPVVELVDAGTYTVVATNSNGCQVSDTITIHTVSEEISSAFLVSSQVFTNESFVILNISESNLDEVIWNFPEGIEVVETANSHAEIIATTEGEYNITMSVKMGDCVQEQTKTVLVIDREEFDGEDTAENPSMIIDYLVFPNPAPNGNFSVAITLKEVQPIKLQMFNTVNNTRIDFRSADGSTEYEENYQMNAPSGLYFIVLETPYAVQIQKVIIE
ncbi:SprB repeat-containing protein [Aquimarina brevivitae]|uniref:Putative secreted protein (Por secretion system target) n=1 Tax=Aquimarina brevivitae TaxID=323412 RepID=A0A4V2F5P8_9FLAO|nr:SprB repeat-containing protein [Aquimarina brevivitae]RZS93569.1 putative secreted protein (Por secretion system target) [Aquimarina brevivitae]